MYESSILTPEIQQSVRCMLGGARASLRRWWILSQRADHSEAIFWEMCVISLYIIITYVNATRMFDLYLRFEQWVRQALGICLGFDGSDPDYRARMEWRPNSTFQTNHFIMQKLLSNSAASSHIWRSNGVGIEKLRLGGQTKVDRPSSIILYCCAPSQQIILFEFGERRGWRILS